MNEPAGQRQGLLLGTGKPDYPRGIKPEIRIRGNPEINICQWIAGGLR
jgi:hypothetical protein